jgi:hypothetical protein
MYSPAAMEMAPAMVPESAVNKMSVLDKCAPVTPAMSKNVETKPEYHHGEIHGKQESELKEHRACVRVDSGAYIIECNEDSTNRRVGERMS